MGCSILWPTSGIDPRHLQLQPRWLRGVDEGGFHPTAAWWPRPATLVATLVATSCHQLRPLRLVNTFENNPLLYRKVHKIAAFAQHKTLVIYKSLVFTCCTSQKVWDLSKLHVLRGVVWLLPEEGRGGSGATAILGEMENRLVVSKVSYLQPQRWSRSRLYHSIIGSILYRFSSFFK